MTARGGDVASVLRIVGVFGTVLLTAQFQRASLAVLAPELARDPGLTPEQLGMLGSAYYLSFALASIPVGILVDRIGASRVVAAQLTIAALGAAVFANAQDFWALAGGRFLVGIGNAGVVMAGLVVISRWFRAERFTLLTSLTIIIGNVGQLLATTPLAAATVSVGWRAAFVIAALATLLVAGLVFLMIRDAPPGHPSLARPRETPAAAASGMIEVLRIPHLFNIGALNFVGYATLGTVLSLWSGVYLRDVHGVGDIARGNLLLFLTCVVMAATLGYGMTDRRIGRPKWVAVAGAGASSAAMFALAALAQPPLWLALALLTMFVAVASYPVAVIGHARSVVPDRLMGRGLAAFNLAAVLGSAVIQAISGLIIGAFAGHAGAVVPEAGFRFTFLFLAGMILAALLCYVRAPEVRPRA